MKIATSKEFTIPIKTLKIQLRDLKPEVRKGIEDKGLYFLESIFGNCDGHGRGFGREDINFTIEDGDKRYFVYFNFDKCLDDKCLDVYEHIELYDQNGKNLDQEETLQVISNEVVRILTKKLCKKGKK